MVDQQQTSLGRKVARRLLLILGIIVLVLSLGLLCFFPFSKNLGWKEAPITSRQILGDNCGRQTGLGAPGRMPYYGYTYAVDGKTYITSDCSPSLKNVVYFPPNPNIAINDGSNIYIYLLVFAFIGVVVIGVALLFK
ncbi:MAG: hypothetical protein JWN75_862 [Candidatus Saccharibacteria bacterium]|nr:hypothetical protein [Candidatus Saccharibacteria bacterium]